MNNRPVIICIGSSGVCGDSLGPMVGDLLKDKYNVNAYVYGGIGRPVNGVNFNRYVNLVKSKHRGSLIIAVDACVGEAKDVGKIKYSLKGVNAGGALNKNLERVGDIGVLGVVAERQKDNLSALMAASFNLVEKMSAAIALKLSALLTDFDLIFSLKSFNLHKSSGFTVAR